MERKGCKVVREFKSKIHFSKASTRDSNPKIIYSHLLEKNTKVVENCSKAFERDTQEMEIKIKAMEN